MFRFLQRPASINHATMNLALHRRRFAPLLNAVAGAPWSRSRRLMCLASVLLALWLPALACDLPVARWIKGHKPTGEVHKLLSKAETFCHAYGILAILLAVAVLDRRGWRVVPRLLTCSLGAGIVADGVKLFVARSRPKAALLEAPVWETFVGWFPAWNSDALPRAWTAALQSFPSGHTAAGVGLAIGLSILYPRGRWLFAALAMLGALQRIESQSHFISDTIAGAALAALLAALFFAPGPTGGWFNRLESAAWRGTT